LPCRVDRTAEFPQCRLHACILARHLCRNAPASRDDPFRRRRRRTANAIYADFAGFSSDASCFTVAERSSTCLTRRAISSLSLAGAGVGVGGAGVGAGVVSTPVILIFTSAQPSNTAFCWALPAP